MRRPRWGKLGKLIAGAIAPILIAIVPEHRLFDLTWRLANVARFATWLLGLGASRAVTGSVFFILVDQLVSREARFVVRYTPLDPLLDVWDRYGAVLVTGPHAAMLARPLGRAIHDAGRECVGIVRAEDAVRVAIGTAHKSRHIPAGPHSLLAARRALLEGKALIVLIDQAANHSNLAPDRLWWIDGKPSYIYANTFRLAMSLGVPIVFHWGSVQQDGSVALAFETPRCVVPKSDEDVQACMDDYELFIRKQVAAGWV
jgi:lauroyl/myristoyl acyltransferase